MLLRLRSTGAAGLALLVAAAAVSAQPTNTFVVAVYNVENWLAMTRNGQPDQPKPAPEKQAVLSILEAIRPDVLGLVEVGNTNDLAEIAAALGARGLTLPYQEWIEAADPTRHVALLSRFPITERHSRTTENYLLEGRPTRMARGILDVRLQLNDRYGFRAVVVHLKSKVPSRIGDESVMRLEEARLLRRHIEGALQQAPGLNLIAMGDFNDTPDSEPVAVVIGDEPFRLFDLKPVAGNGGHDTHYWAARGLYSRIDYLLVSPGMHREYVAGSARIADFPEWKQASDHRALYASFYDVDIGEPATAATPRVFRRGLIAAIIIVAAAAAVAVLVLRRSRR
jgi:endonuclease/exonuclease/phosphatase family metal-dependent hydrolase